MTLLCFGAFYFPLLKVNEEKIEDPVLGTILGIVIAVAVSFLMLVTREIVGRLIPQRRPSSKLAEYYFVVMTMIVFFMLFYLVSTACFYVFATRKALNDKLKTFFMAVVVFLIANIFLAALDLPYRRSKGKRDTLLQDPSAAEAYCQKRLHE